MAGAIRLPPTLHVLERGWLSSNSIVCEDGDRVSVVDTGFSAHDMQTAQLIDHVRRGKPLARIINTHLHSDHVGGNARLQALHRPATAIPPGLAWAVDAWDTEALTYAPTNQFCPRFRYDALLHAGDRLLLGGLEWEIIAAPGHDPHMVMLYNDDERLLISADALWEHGFGAIFPEIEGDSGFDEQRRALDFIAQCEPRAVIPGHGAPFTGVAAALDRAQARLDALASDHERNARSVLKVLMKFWLLEVRAASLATAIAHFGAARYCRVIHERYFADFSFAAMIERAARELHAGGAAAVVGDRIFNRD